MALLNKDNLYIKIDNIENNLVNYTTYFNKEDRENEKKTSSFINNLKNKALERKNYLYENMMKIAEKIGYTEDDYKDIESIQKYCSKHPDFKIAYDNYTNFNIQEHDFNLFLDDYAENYPIIPLIENLDNNVKENVLKYKVKKIKSGLYFQDEIDSLEKAYKKMKEFSFFGETEDV